MSKQIKLKTVLTKCVTSTLVVTTLLTSGLPVFAQTKEFDSTSLNSSVTVSQNVGSIPIKTTVTKEDNSSGVVTQYGSGGTIWSDGSWQDNLPEGRVKVAKQLTPIADYFHQTSWAKYSMWTLDQDDSLPPMIMMAIKYGESFKSNKYNTKSLESLPVGISKGVTILDIVSNPRIQGQLNEAVKRSFPYTNPSTGKPDFTGNEWYAKYVGVGVASGMIGGRVHNNKLYFDGTAEVTRAEYIKMLNFCVTGVHDEIGGEFDKASIDGVASKSDWYRLAYNQFVTSPVSTLYKLYTKEELSKPITRAEMAYITVSWTHWRSIEAGFTSKFKTGHYADWNNPDLYKNIFSDMNYQLDKSYITSVVEDESGVAGQDTRISTRLRDYLKGRTMSKVISDAVSRKKPLPLPLYMSIFELNKSGVLKGFGNKQVGALKTLTRAEALTIVFNISKTLGVYGGDPLDWE